MELSSIRSQRSFLHDNFWQIVYRWEDIFSQHLEIPIISHSKYLHFIKEAVPAEKSKSLIFDMGPKARIKIPFIRANQSIIPYIIDFWCTDSQIPNFIKAYKKAPFVLISSREVYEYLRRQEVPISIEHLALSIPDEDAKVTEKNFFEKKYDLVLAGRTSNLWNKWIIRYSQEHPEFKLVIKKFINGSYIYEYEGKIICNADDRKDYLDLLSESKVFLYSTPGIDGDKKTNGFHPVTPRFLEGLTAGCNMILRYANNSDTEYYELNKFNDSVENYEIFSLQMDKALTRSPDLDFYANYLSKHTTSQRAKELKEILKKY